MRKAFAAAALLALVSHPALSADISPGLWEIMMETRVAASPDFAPGPFKLNQCLTAADARNPERVLGQVANPGAQGCEYTDKNYSGNTLTFTMRCSGSFAIQSRGRVSYSSDAMDGTITATANVGGKVVETQNRISAHRLGGC